MSTSSSDLILHSFQRQYPYPNLILSLPLFKIRIPSPINLLPSTENSETEPESDTSTITQQNKHSSIKYILTFQEGNIMHIEKHKIRSCQQERKKKVQLNMSNNGRGGGTEGVFLLGVALAIASLAAAFTFKKGSNSRKHSNKDHTKNSKATDTCRKEEDGTQGLRFVLQEDSSSTLHQNSCCTDHGTTKIGVTGIETCKLESTQSLITLEENTMQCERKDSIRGILIHDAEQESIAVTGDYGDIEELSRSVSDHKPMNVFENESNESSVMKTIEIEIEDEAVDTDTEPLTAEENLTLQSSTEEDKPPFTAGEEVEEECFLVQSLFSTEEEEEYSPIRSSFSTAEEEEEDDDDDDDDEEFSPIRSSFSTEEEEYSPMESSFSTEEEDENGENFTEMEEESSEETRSSSPESNMEAIWPAEMMGILSPESKEINIRHRPSVKKFEEKDTIAKIEAYHYESESGSEDNKETQELVLMIDKKEQHSAKQQIWVWMGLVLLLLFLLANCLLHPSYLSETVSSVFFS